MNIMRKKNEKLWNHLHKELNDFVIKAGWFENSRYDAETPVAGIAAVQNYGCIIDNPGGQPYYINGNTGLAVFLSRKSVTGRYYIKIGKVTKQHYIIIPPRPFYDNAKERIKTEGIKIIKQELLRVLDGRQTMEQATNRFGLWMQGVIQEEIKKINSPALSPSTIRERNSVYRSKSKNKSTKPLNASGIMYDSVQYQVEKKQ